MKEALVHSLVLSAMLLVGCQSAPVEGSPQGTAPQQASPKRLVAAMRSNPTGMYSQLTSGRATSKPMEALYHVGLASVDNTDALQPRLGVAVPTIEKGLWTIQADGHMELTWTIRPNAIWHDGVPFTAQDLVFTAAVLRDQKFPELGNVNYGYLDGVEARDDRTAVIRWRQPFIDADTLFSSALGVPLPQHLLERAYEGDRAQFLALPYWGHELVGTGPFKIREWVEGSHIALEAFDQYALGRPKLDAIEVRFVTETTTIETGMLAGVVELTLGTTGLSLEEVLEFKERWSGGRVETTPAALRRLDAQMIDPNPAVILDVRFRRALLQAIDRQEIINTLEGGLTSIPASFLPPNQPEFREVEANVTQYPYDPRAAIQAIEALGYTKGSDGFFRDQTAQRLNVEIQTPGGDDNQNKIMFAVADFWQRAGVAVDPVVIPVQEAADRQRVPNRSGFHLGGGPSGLLGLHIFTTQQVPRAENGWLGQNRSRYVSPDYDALYDRYLTTIPKHERDQALARLMEHIATNLPILPVYFRVAPSLISNRVIGAGPTRQGNEQSWNAHEWDLRSAE